MVLIGDNNMEFDSFLVIEDNGQRRKININTHRRKQKVLYQSIFGSLVERTVNTSGKNSNKIELHHNIRTYDINQTDDDIFKVYKKIKLWQSNTSKDKKALRLIRKAEKFENKRQLKDNYCETISKSTIRNLKKHLGKYGYISVKAIYSFSGRNDIAFRVGNEEVFKHLYLYNSQSKYSISILDYININLISLTNNEYLIGNYFLDTGDTLVNNRIILQKGDFNQFRLNKVSSKRR